jgi:hypothetical protein
MTERKTSRFESFKFDFDFVCNFIYVLILREAVIKERVFPLKATKSLPGGD